MIQTKDLTMHYGPVVALDNVSFEVHQGEIVGLLGTQWCGQIDDDEDFEPRICILRRVRQLSAGLMC